MQKVGIHVLGTSSDHHKRDIESIPGCICCTSSWAGVGNPLAAPSGPCIWSNSSLHVEERISIFEIQLNMKKLYNKKHFFNIKKKTVKKPIFLLHFLLPSLFFSSSFKP